MQSKRIGFGLGLSMLSMLAGAAMAQPAGEPRDLPVIGVPTPGGVNYQPAMTDVAHDMHWLSHWVHGIMLGIVLLVVVLIATVALRYNSRRNPNPAHFTHNTRIEIAWTLGPVVILILIGSFSLPILFKQLEVPTPADLTIKATGNQWYWSYDYPENQISFDSLLLPAEDLEAYGYSPDLHLLATDTAVVVPVGKVVHMLVTGSDVIHSWTIPSFGVKIDAIPGRLNETWFRIEEEGIYFGQCSELCGKDHSFMPITVKAVSQEDYDAWLEWAIAEYGGVRNVDEQEEQVEAPEGEANPAAGGAGVEVSPAGEGAVDAPSEEAAPEQDQGGPAEVPADGRTPGAEEVPTESPAGEPGSQTGPGN